MKRHARAPAPSAIALAGTLLVHVLGGVLLFAGVGAARTPPPPTYKVRLVAAPAAEQETRRAPEAVSRPAEEQAPPLPSQRQPRSTVSRATPPREADNVPREAAPRTTPDVQPLPGERPSTGNDVATVSTEGVDFPFPEYLQNMVSQILRRWQRPNVSTPLEAEVSFLVRRDGTISDLRFVRRSGNFGFDLEAQGAVEEAGRFRAFGELPEGWGADVLFVRFYFSGVRR
jgi:outer membrane biosynthesis protein TonB